MKNSVTPDRSSAETPVQERILGAAFKSFTEDGYAGTSTLEIARRAKVSKRDLYATNLVREVSHPSVIATFRLAIAEATRSPEIAQALDVAGRNATRDALAELLANAQSSGLIRSGEPTEMATQYLGLLWEGLLVGLLLGVATTPEPAECERRAAKATAAFMQLHPTLRRTVSLSSPPAAKVPSILI